MSTIEWARPLNKSSNQQRARPMSFTSADGIVQAEMARGSLQIWTDHVLYGAGANRSDAARFGAGAAYILGWLRQEENQCLAVPPEIARTLPENLQRLVGYQLSDGLGFSGDVGKDPIEVLRT
jgi:ectoine hydroxylase-related dioxygenase (phytanoyl-CoA dioxygenase family)